jgi:ectoine hydroxylase-related dioxygenase (phytanoyl-CoA dioxygenase family)
MREDEAGRFLEAFEELERHFGAGLRREHLKYLHLSFQWAYKLATLPRVLDTVESLLGPNLLVHSSSMFYKAPADGAFVDWHQDGNQIRLSGPEYVTAWIALTPSTADNGCMKVIPRSHTTRIAHENRGLPGNQLDFSVTGPVDESAAVDVVLAPGEFSLHHPDLIHGSGLNRGGGKRIGFAVRYIAPFVSQWLVHPPVLLARGRDDHRNFVHSDAPTGGSLAECAARQVEIHREYTRRRNAQVKPTPGRAS